MRGSQTSSKAKFALPVAHFTGRFWAWKTPTEHLLLAEELPVHPSRAAGIAVVAVDVAVLTEERIRALGRGQTAHPAEGREVEPGVVLLLDVEVAVRQRADALQVERLEDRVEPRLALNRLGVWLELRLGILRETAVVVQAAEVVEQEVALDAHFLVPRVDRAGVRVEVVGRRRAAAVEVPHELVREQRVIRIQFRERHPGDVAGDVAPVGRELHLSGVLLGRLPVGLGQFDLLVLADRDRHAVFDAPLHAGRDHVGDLGHIRGIELLPGLDAERPCGRGTERHARRRERDADRSLERHLSSGSRRPLPAHDNASGYNAATRRVNECEEHLQRAAESSNSA